MCHHVVIMYRQENVIVGGSSLSVFSDVYMQAVQDINM